tara:strand:+ start:304 stop:771 length:468 start_codon:yes stop_codon:yes gene_type:complete
MSFKLSERSLSKLEGVHENLVSIVKEAITLTKVDFGVICGLRSEAEQKELFNKGASQTLHSKHLPQRSTGKSHAVDLMAYVGSRASWELNLYDDIADAMATASKNQKINILWGAAWTVNISNWEGTMNDAMNEYIDFRRSSNRKPFIDGPHFELV